jgi:hypothetical protein
MWHIMKFYIKTSVVSASLALVKTTILFSITVVHAQGMEGHGFDQGQRYNQGQPQY